MTENLASDAHLPDAHRISMVTLFEVATTGERPIHCLGEDSNEYWCKAYDGPGGGETVVNEIVSHEIGRALDAPVCDWAVVDIPEGLAGKRYGDTVISRLPMFGSRALKDAVVDEHVRYIEKDDNYHRFPLLIALWYMCNAEDIQWMYSLAEDYSVYSLDHGYWFGSHEISRELAPITSPAGRTSVPHLPSPIPRPYWGNAIEKLKNFKPETLSHISSYIPAEWGVDSEIITAMVSYAVGRIPYVIEKLEQYQRRAEP